MKFGNLEILDNQRSLEKGLFVLLYCIAGQSLVLENVKIIIALLFPVVFLPRAYPEQNVTISDANWTSYVAKYTYERYSYKICL